MVMFPLPGLSQSQPQSSQLRKDNLFTMAQQFIHRVATWIANELVTKRLANSPMCALP